MKIKILSVSEVSRYINNILSMDVILNNINIKGEISNYKIHSSGHVYFSLKDSNSKLTCVMFSNDRNKLNFIPKEGMKVVVKGKISVYERQGQYQLYVREMYPQGMGELYLAYEQLKKKLKDKGWFDELGKKSIPFLPKKIGVVTSPTGAAIRDIITVITRRNPNVEIIIFPVLVQGEQAKYQIANAIDYLNEENMVDVIITGRGGGSIEELWAFNEENVVESIHNSKIPIISAVGHETDFTISDFVADLRAATPSAAGELVIPNLVDINSAITNYTQRLFLIINMLKEKKKKGLEKIEKSYAFTRPLDIIYQYRQQLDWIQSNLEKDINNKLDNSRYIINNYYNKIIGINPNNILKRGYAIIKDSENNILNSVNNVSLNQNIIVKLLDGSLEVTINKIKKGDI